MRAAKKKTYFLKRGQLRLTIRGKTNIGRIRDNNEDNIFIPKNGDVKCIMVADGMGGHQAGEIASEKAISIVMGVLNEYGEKLMHNPQEVIKSAIMKANLSLASMGKSDKRLSGMGTTLTLALPTSKKVIIGHVGDSRAYLFSGGRLKRLTRDHSMVQELIDMGKLTETEALSHPHRNVITRALGTSYHVLADIIETKWKANDILMLCTDGLTNCVPDDEVLDILKSGMNRRGNIKHSELEAICDTLIDRALVYGGTDNISVVLAANSLSEVAAQ
jgi:serine/threonine protein phosphatase PrpC